MNKPIRHLLTMVAATAAVVSVGTLPADAAARITPSVSFFQGGNGNAHWSHDESNGDDKFSMELDVPDASSYGGAYLHHVEGQPAPEEAPSFDFYSTVSGLSGGSPRLHINFSDGGGADLRPQMWEQDMWTTVDGNGMNWDSNGLTCGYQYATTYAAVLACHPGATVTSAYVVSDSGWLHPEGYVHYIDNLQYGGVTISQPSDNRRG